MSAPDPAQWRAAEALWEQAEQLGASDIDAFLATQGELDPAVVALFRRLWAGSDETMAASAQTDQFAQRLLQGSAGRGREGQQIGRFRLLKLLGEGGAGVVYLAEEVDQDLRHQVALKLLHQRYSENDPALRAALHERRMLARLTHPCIPRYLDSGLSEDGLCFVVSEYVDGRPITRYVREQRCTARQVLELYAQTARAVHHAHQNLIIHRDIKPSNLLVDSRHRLPKLLDFGIARDLQGRTVDEQTVVFAYTPAYASPEQLAGSATIGTPTDLYSLGLVLFELIHGRLPVDAQLTQAQARRDALRKLPWPKADADRALSLRGLSRAQRVDLDTVLRRLLAFHPEDRYPSAEALAADVDSILADRTISVGHYSWRRRAQRVLARHKAWSAAAALALLLALGAASVYVMQARNLAVQAQRLASVKSVLTELLTRPDPLRRGNRVTLAETVLEMAPELAADQSIEPAVKAEIETILAGSLLRLGEVEQAQRLLQGAQSRIAQLPEDADLRRTLALTQALSEMESGRYATARDRAEGAVAALRRSDDPRRLAESLRVLATAEIHAERNLDAAIAHCEEALELLQQTEPVDLTEVLAARTVLALAHTLAGRLQLAQTLQEQILVDAVSQFGELSGQSFDPRNNLARTLQRQGEYDRAGMLLDANLALAESLFGTQAPDTLMAQNNLALNYFRQQRFAQAAPLMRRVHEGRLAVLGPDHPRTLMAASNLADGLLKIGEVEEACQLSLTAREELRRNSDSAPHLLGYPSKVYARCLRARGELTQAQAALAEVIALWQEVLGEDHLETLNARTDHAELLAALGQREAALAQLEQIIAQRSARYGQAHPGNVQARELQRQIAQAQ